MLPQIIIPVFCIYSAGLTLICMSKRKRYVQVFRSFTQFYVKVIKIARVKYIINENEMGT